LSYCELYQRLVPTHSELHQPLLIAIVVTYCKPFTGAKVKVGKNWVSSWGDSHTSPIFDGNIYPAVELGGSDVLFDTQPEDQPGVSIGMLGIRQAWRDMHSKILRTLRHKNYAHSDGRERAPHLDWDFRPDEPQPLRIETLLGDDVPVIEDMCRAALAVAIECLARAEAGDLACAVEDCADCATRPATS